MTKKWATYLFLIVIIIILLYLVISIYYMNKDVNEGFQIGKTGISSICLSNMSEYKDPNICYDISYIDSDNKNVQVKAKIEPNYYIDASGMLEIVPYGYQTAPNKKSYIPKTSVSMYNSGINYAIDASINKIQTLMLANPPPSKEKVDQYKKDIARLQEQKTSSGSDNKTSNSDYNPDNFNMTYHADPPVNSTDESTAGAGKMWVKDASGKLIAVPYDAVKNTTLYYQTGSYPFGPSSYVPNYEESVFLSKLTNTPTTSKVYDTATKKAGFCASTESSMIEREKKCMALSEDTCAATDCCVSFGGQKCVAGDISGPSIKSNYSDFLITNKDYYYFKGECYGNCL